MSTPERAIDPPDYPEQTEAEYRAAFERRARQYPDDDAFDLLTAMPPEDWARLVDLCREPVARGQHPIMGRFDDAAIGYIIRSWIAPHIWATANRRVGE